jgi:phosphoglycerol transferase
MLLADTTIRARRLLDQAPLTVEILLCVGLLAWIFVQALAVPYPVVFSDEASYSLFSKFGGGAKVQDHIGLPIDYPDHLYFQIYRVVHRFGDNFLAAAKLLNALFFALSAFPIHRLCRMLLPPPHALLVTAVAIAGPFSTFATYFMPESMYFFGFWTYAYAVVALRRRPRTSQAAVQGVCLGVLALVKPHAVALLVPSMIALVMVAGPRIRKATSLLPVATSWIVLIMVFAITKAALTLLLATSAEVSLGGEGYRQYLMTGVSLSSIASRVPSYLFVLQGHLIYLVVLCGPFIVAIVIGYWKVRATDPTGEPGPPLFVSIFASSVIVTLLFMTVKFTADIAGSGPHETIERVHGRYYEFALPLLLIAALTFADARKSSPRHDRSPVCIGLAVWLSLLAIYVLAEVVGEYARHARSISDFPAAALLGATRYRIAVAAASFAAGLWIVLNERRSATIILTTALIMLVGSELAANAILRRVGASPADYLALAAKQLIPASEIDDGVVVANDADGRLYRVLFHLNSLSRALVLPPGIAVQPEDIGEGRKWLLLLDEVPLAVAENSRIVENGVVLVNLSDVQKSRTLGAGDIEKGDIYDRVIPLAKGAQPSVALSGFHGREGWGAWTKDEAVTFELPLAVDGRLDLNLRGWAFGENAQRPVRVSMGSQSREVRFFSRVATVTASFDLPSPASTIVIDGITPQSPELIHAYNDPRLLGLGIESIAVRRR